MPSIVAGSSRAVILCLPKIASAQVGQLFGFGGGRVSWLSAKVRSLRHDDRLCCFD
jgi:hypothetical protein